MSALEYFITSRRPV